MGPDKTGLTRQFRKACRCRMAQANVRPVAIVIPPPVLHNMLHSIDALIGWPCGSFERLRLSWRLLRKSPLIPPEYY